MTLDLTFADHALEKQFAGIVNQANRQQEEVGGILFWQWGQINHIHWAKHNRLFNCKAIPMITDWIVCPNVSNLRDREYQVSDLRQLIGIAEQTSTSRRCMFLHFHTHPNQEILPSDQDKWFWDKHFDHYGQANGVIAAASPYHDGLALACYSRINRNQERLTVSGRFLTWKFINQELRHDARKRSGKS